jgi:nucleoside-diphosphate-sugar epimerase
MDTVAILGANGVYARWLIPRLTQRGYKVRALVRRPEAASVAIACGAEVRVADIFDEASLIAGLDRADIGINLATSLPGPSGRGAFDANDRLRREGTPIWVKACRDAGVRRVLQQSIAMVNAAGDAIADEDTPFVAREESAASRAIDAALIMEGAVRASGLDWAILRGGLFYGPGTGFDDEWLSRAQAGKLRMPGDGTDYVSLLHIADMARATMAALEHWPSRQTLIVADDEPAQWRDVFTYIAQIAGAEPPAPGGRPGFPSFRVSNRRAREALSWAPFYTNYRTGLIR